MNKVKLEVIGLSYSQSQSGAYALIIGEVGANRRLPIIIGQTEAQSIALELENFKTNRPLTHDLFYNFAIDFNISLIEVIINKFSEGVFYSLLVCKQGDTIKNIDARTSDAVALALRFKCPITTYESIMETASIVLTQNEDENSNTNENIQKEDSENLDEFSIEELKKMLEDSIKIEDFERASILRDKIKNRLNK